MPRRVVLPALIGALLLDLVARPIAIQQAPALPARPIFRSGVEYVSVDVVVTDKNDRPVSGLQPRDFEIREAGRVQTITDFAHYVVPANNRRVDLRDAPPPVDVASNPLPSRESRTFVFVIDDGTVLTQDLVPLKQAMTDFLKKLSPDDEAAVVYIKRSDLSQDLTRDVGQLIRAVNNINAAIGWSPDARATKVVLENVISTLTTSPQTRRVIVYASGGFKTPSSALTTINDVWAPPDLVELFERARYANVPIYTLDPHGLASPESVFNLGGRMEDQTPENRRRQQVTISQFQQFLLTVAENTGGRGFVNQTRLSATVDQIMSDNGSYYMLGYSPTPYNADGRFHEIDVKVVSRPDLRVRARKGYVAAKPVVPSSDPHASLLNRLTDGQPHTELSLRAFGAAVAPSARGVTTALMLDLSYPAAPGTEERADDELHVVFLAIDSDARVKASEQRTYQMKLAGQSRDAMTVSLNETLDLPKGRMILRIGVSSRLLGKAGTVHLPVDVRALAGQGLEPTALILGLVQTPDLVAHAEAIAEQLPFQPTTRRSFFRDQQLRVFTRVFTDTPATLQVELQLKSAKTTRKIPVRLGQTKLTQPAVDCEALLDLKDLPAGDYVLDFTARISRDRSSVRAVSFQLQ